MWFSETVIWLWYGTCLYSENVWQQLRVIKGRCKNFVRTFQFGETCENPKLLICRMIRIWCNNEYSLKEKEAMVIGLYLYLSCVCGKYGYEMYRFYSSSGQKSSQIVSQWLYTLLPCAMIIFMTMSNRLRIRCCLLCHADQTCVMCQRNFY